MDEFECAFHRVETESARRQQSAPAIEKHGEMTEHQMMSRARVRAILTLMSSTSGNKCIEFANPDFNAAINIRQYLVLKTRPRELTQCSSVGQPLRVVLRPNEKRNRYQELRQNRLERVCGRVLIYPRKNRNYVAQQNKRASSGTALSQRGSRNTTISVHSRVGAPFESYILVVSLALGVSHEVLQSVRLRT